MTDHTEQKKELTLRDYQREATKFACYENLNYPYFALVEEVGELYGKLAKTMRGDKVIKESELMSEMGDVLWNLSEIASQRGWSLSDIAVGNLVKLHDRANRNVIKGDGDER